MPPPLVVCPRCHTTVYRAAFCSQCGLPFGTPPEGTTSPKKRFPVWKIAAIIAAVLLAPCAVCVPFSLLSTAKAPAVAPRYEIVWESLGPEEARGYVRNLASAPQPRPFLTVTHLPATGGLGVTGSVRQGYPHWDGENPALAAPSVLIPPGGQDRFTFQLSDFGVTDGFRFPVALAASVHDPATQATTAAPFIQRRASDPEGTGTVNDGRG